MPGGLTDGPKLDRSAVRIVVQLNFVLSAEL